MTRPTAYGPELAPPGVAIRWVNAAFSRAKIKPRLLLMHTNAASGPASLDSIWNWANAGGGNTIPHYQVQRDGSAMKLLPTDRKGIANYRAADFSLAIETQDLGFPTPGPIPYTSQQADTIARIIAFEYITWEGNIPLRVPLIWEGSGVGNHTEPFGYPYWTNARGKTCPGQAKKDQLRSLLLPLASRYVQEWIVPEVPPFRPIPGVPDMFHPIQPYRNSDTRVFGGPGVAAKTPCQFGLNPGIIPADAVAVAMNVAVVNPATGGFATVWPAGAIPNASCVNWDVAGGAHNGTVVTAVQDGAFFIQTSAQAHLVCDVTGYWTP